MGITLQDEKIIDRWSKILKNSKGNASQIYKDK